MTDDQYRMLRSFQKSLENDRVKYEEDFKKIGRYIVPARADWEWDDTGVDRPKLFDATGVDSNQKLADGYQGYMVNPRALWMKLRMEDEKLNNDHKMKAWLAIAEKLMYVIFARSNFYSAIGQCFSDQAFGTVVLYIEPDEETIINFVPQHLKGMYIAEDSHERIDTVFHKMKVRNRVIVRDYGEGLKPERREELMKDPFGRTLLWRAVLPNEEYEHGKIGPKGMLWSSTTYLDDDNDKPLKESGYKKMPYVVWRPLKVTGEAYGRSFAWWALGDVLRINQLEKTVLEVALLQAKPPLNVPGEILDQVNVTQWGLNPYTEPDRQVFPMNIGGNLGYSVEEREQLQNQIRGYFHVDAFQLLSMMADKEYTATQAAEMAGEKSALLTAHTSRVGSELLDPIIECTLFYAIEAGFIPEPPVAIPTHGLKVDYVGPLTMDQDRAFKTNGIVRAMNMIAPFMEQKPEIWDLIRDDRMFRDLLDGAGMPDRHMNNEQEVEVIRKARAEQAQAQQQSDLNKAGAQAYKDGTWKPAEGSLSKERMDAAS